MRLKFQRYFLFIATLVLWSFLTPAVAQTSADNVIIDMAQAYRKADRRSLEALLPRAKGHLLEPWAAYWTYSAQLNELSTPELQGFFNQYAGPNNQALTSEIVSVVRGLGSACGWPCPPPLCAGHWARCPPCCWTGRTWCPRRHWPWATSSCTPTCLAPCGISPPGAKAVGQRDAEAG